MTCRDVTPHFPLNSTNKLTTGELTSRGHAVVPRDFMTSRAFRLRKTTSGFYDINFLAAFSLEVLVR